MAGPPRSLDTPPADRRWAIGEIFMLVLLMFLHAGRMTPDVNEVHYLAKARHVWQPSWCAGDLLLESADVHYLFFAAWGWTMRWLSMDAAAWLGRGLLWTALACAWWRLVQATVAGRGRALLAAAVFLPLQRWGHLSGEWMVGGVEAKPLAYALLLWGLAWLAEGHWRRVWPAMGAAAAWHVLVGGWGVMAAAVAWCLDSTERRPAAHRLLVPLLLGGLFALVGLLPALAASWSASPEIVAEGQEVYVYDRLAHHLVAHKFPAYRVLRFGILVAALVGLAFPLRRQPALRALAGFTAGCVGLAVVGWAIDSTLPSSAREASLLRYYWFRLGDVLVPAAVAILAVAAIAQRLPKHGRWQTAAWLGLASAAGLGMAAYWIADRQAQLPPADGQGDLAAVSRPVLAWSDWVNAAHWARSHTHPRSLFLTPDRIQTFKWYGQRAELANWKHIPQDPAAAVEWYRRRQDVHWALQDPQQAADRLDVLARKYEIDFAVLWNHQLPAAAGVRRVYRNGSFTIVELRSGGRMRAVSQATGSD